MCIYNYSSMQTSDRKRFPVAGYCYTDAHGLLYTNNKTNLAEHLLHSSSNITVICMTLIWIRAAYADKIWIYYGACISEMEHI